MLEIMSIMAQLNRASIESRFNLMHVGNNWLHCTLSVSGEWLLSHIELDWPIISEMYDKSNYIAKIGHWQIYNCQDNE